MSFHEFRGVRTGTRRQQSATFSQASTRHPGSSFDQHGRKWSWPADNRSGMPCGQISPLFSAPFIPDMQYLMVNPDDTGELYIDYPRMYRERREALRDFHALATRWATKNGRPAPKMGDYTLEMIEGVGAAPPRSLELIAAAAQENPYILGFDDTPDPRLVPFLEHTSRELEDELDNFQFGADSYRHAVAGRHAPTKKQERPKPRTFKSLDALEAAADELDLPDAANVGEGIGEEDDEEGGETGDVESIPSEDEGAEAELSDDDAAALAELDADVGAGEDSLDVLLDLEDEADAEALGGRRVKPEKSDMARRQQPRSPNATSKPRKRAQAQAAAQQQRSPGRQKPRPFDPKKGRSLADGATPYVGGQLADEG